MAICFRRAVKEDFDRINTLFVEMLQTIFEKEVAEGYKAGEMDYYFSGGEDWICIAEDDGEICGFLSIEVHREQENYLYYDDFSVSGAHRGKGIGTALMNKAEEYARSLGILLIVLHVEKSNTGARRLYERSGFTLLRDEGTRLCLCKHLDESAC